MRLSAETPHTRHSVTEWGSDARGRLPIELVKYLVVPDWANRGVLSPYTERRPNVGQTCDFPDQPDAFVNSGEEK